MRPANRTALSVAAGPARDLANARRCATCKATIGAVGAPTCGPCTYAARLSTSTPSLRKDSLA